MPFAGYSSFEDCVSQNRNKDDPDAYCGSIKHRVEDKLDGPAEVPDRRLTLAVAGASLAATDAVLALHRDSGGSTEHHKRGRPRGGEEHEVPGFGGDWAQHQRDIREPSTAEMFPEQGMSEEHEGNLYVPGEYEEAKRRQKEWQRPDSSWGQRRKPSSRVKEQVPAAAPPPVPHSPSVSLAVAEATLALADTALLLGDSDIG